MKLLIVGAGMYVTGRGDTGVGTVLSSIAETSRTIDFVEVVVLARSPDNEKIVHDRVREINADLGAKLKVKYRCLGESAKKTLEKLQSEINFDCAIVSVPDHLHYEYIKILMTLCIHVFVVKPLVETVEQNLELLQIQEQNNVYGAVEYHKRFDESNLYAKKILQRGGLGRISYIGIDYSQRINIPLEVFRAWAERSNIFQYLGVHYVDLIYFLTGFLPVKVNAYGTSGILKDSGVDSYDSIHVMIEWCEARGNSKFVSVFNTNWIDPLTSSALSDQKYKIIGSEGRMDIDQKNRGIEQADNNGVQHINPYFSMYLPCDGYQQHQGYAQKSIEQFIRDVVDIKSGEKNWKDLDKDRPSFRQALISTAVIQGVNESLKTNTWVKINVEI